MSLDDLEYQDGEEGYRDEKFHATVVREGHSPLAPDEITFTFRAHDKLMPGVLWYYAELAEANGSPASHVERILDCRRRVLSWQEANGAEVPD